MSRYLNPYTDFGFKKLFGEEGSKDLLIDFLLKHLDSFDHIPTILNEPIFHKAFKTAELANLNREQYSAYEQNLLDYWGVKAAVDTARDEGHAEGRVEGRVEGDHAARLIVARNLLELLPPEVIAQRTGLTVDEVVGLSNNMAKNAGKAPQRSGNFR